MPSWVAKQPPPLKSSAPQPRGRNVLLAFVAAQIVYAAMIGVTLPWLETRAGGLIPFDMLPGGYDLVAAQQLLDALGDEGRAFYLTRQIPLDLLYPGLFALAYSLSWRWLAPRAWPGAPWLVKFSRVAIAAGLADYVENAFIIVMLTSYPHITTEFVTAASIATVIKAVLTTITLTALTVMLVRFAWNHIAAYKRRE